MRTPAAELTIEHALLGFVYVRPGHGYEIYQQLADANGLWQVWRLKQSQLYALLTKLEEAQRLMAEVITTTSDPERGAYHPEAMAARRAAVEFFNVA